VSLSLVTRDRSAGDPSPSLGRGLLSANLLHECGVRVRETRCNDALRVVAPPVGALDMSSKLCGFPLAAVSMAALERAAGCPRVSVS